MLYQQVHRSFWRRHPVVTGGGLLLTLWWLHNGWYNAVAVAAIIGLLIFVARRRVARPRGLRASAELGRRSARHLRPVPARAAGLVPRSTKRFADALFRRRTLDALRAAALTHHTCGQ